MKKKFYIKFFYVLGIIIILFTANIGCNDNNPTAPKPQSSGNNNITKHLFVMSIAPNRMPYSLDSNIIITFTSENINTDSINAHLKIKEFRNNNCTALDINFRMCGYNNEPTILTVPMSELNSCIENNAVYKIVLTNPDTSIKDIKGDSTYYVRGNPTLAQTNVYVEKAAMPSSMPLNNNDLKDSIIAGIDTTYYPTNPPSDTTPNININWADWNSSLNLVDVTVPNFVSGNILDTKEFNAWLNTYAQNIRQNSLGYILILADSCATNPNGIIFGISNNNKYDNGYENWSFVFTTNIDWIYSYDPNVFKRTLYTFNATHELLHQLGNEFSPWPPDEKNPDPIYYEHNVHSGNNASKCVLYPPDRFLYNNPGTWERNKGYFKICDRHTFMLRDNLGSIPPMALRDKNTDPLNNLAAGFNDSKYEVKISLPKFSYKEFEPVDVEIKLINHDSSPLKFWGGLFQLDSYEGLSWATITDDNGNGWSQDNNHTAKFDAILDEPKYIVQPNDTMFLTLMLNDWGKEARWVSDKDNDEYFSRGYFPPNNSYNAHISLKLNCNPQNVPDWKNCINVKSNEVRFEVTELNDSDKEILSLYKKVKDEDLYSLFKKDYSLDNTLETYKYIIEKFPDNPLTETVYDVYLGTKAFNIVNTKNSKYSDGFVSDFKDFINRYSNSLNLLADNFIKLYLTQYLINPSTNELINNFDEAFENFKIQNADNVLKYVLRDKERVKKIVLPPEPPHYKK